MFFEVSAKCTAPFGRDLLIKAARQRARGISWEVIAKKTPHSAGELCRFAVKHPDAWRPLYVRAEKLSLQEAEGQTLAHFTALLKGDDEQAAEQAGRALLLHRRHIERRRRRYEPQRHRDLPAVAGTENQEGLNAAEISCDTGGPARELEEFSVPPCLCGEKEAPAELEIALLAAARGVALGETPASVARETGHAAEEIARWAFIYAKAWDRAYWPARLEAAEFCAALAINRLLDFVAGPDRKLAARAGRTLLVHRRHMHWASTRGDMYRTLLCEVARYAARESPEGGSGTCPPNRAGTYPPSVAQVSVAVPGDGSLTVARRSGPARSSGAVRPSASAPSVSSVVKRFLPRSRDGP